jgi:A1 cistron-splicing factor AAR2
MHLGNYTCIEQWWFLVLKVLLCAHQLAVARPGLCRNLLLTFYAQMVYNDRFIVTQDLEALGSSKHYPGSAASDNNGSSGILDSMPLHKAKLRKALTVYKRRLDQALLGLGDRITQEQRSVGHAFGDLNAWFWRYGWDLHTEYVPEQVDRVGVDDDGEANDYAPVVVELDADGREVGLVSWTSA